MPFLKPRALDVHRVLRRIATSKLLWSGAMWLPPRKRFWQARRRTLLAQFYPGRNTLK